jgi:hypothetical protein
MRRAALLASTLVLCAALPCVVSGQIAPPGTPPPAWTYKTNFAIPDAPAFELLSVDPNTILRPQSTRELALSLSKFQSADGSFTIPQALALEFSPALLIRGERITESGFAAHPRLYNLRLSLAALRGSKTGANARLALGARFTLSDRSQLKNDEAYPADLHVTEVTEQALSVYSAANTRAVKQAREAGEDPSKARMVLTRDEREQLDALASEIRKRWAERYWNAGRMEVAFALRASAADSTGRDPKLDTFSAWFTGTRSVAEWGQGLVGARLAVRRDSLSGDYKQESSLAFRFYAGNSRAKGYLEGQQTMREDAKPRLFVNGGFEMAAAEWVWLNFALGFEREGGGSAHTVTAFKLKTALPGM